MTNQEAIEFLKNMIDREVIGFVCPEREGDVAIWQYHVEALQMAISALQAQEAKAQLSAEGTTSDLIERQDALDALEKIGWIETKADKEYAIRLFTDLPPAQPEIEERTEEFAQNVPKEDLISRKAAIDALKNERSDWNCDYNVPVDHCIDAIYSVPSVQPEPHWIPVSERLPESKPEDLEYPTVIACCEDGEVMTACYYESTKEWGIGENYDRKINPVAWMPLPEPYRAERRTDDANDIT